MKNIKFRVPVYSFKTEKFLRFEYWDAHALCFTLPNGNRSNDEVYEDDEQCTGLKDKNGKSIYEGDIVRYLASEEGGEEGTAKISAYLGRQNLYFEWITQKTSSPSLMSATDYFGCASELEIIGNIHANSEYLR